MFRALVAFTVFLSLTLLGYAQDRKPVVPVSNTEEDVVRATLLTSDLADGWIATATSLSTRRDSPDFLALTDRAIEPIYAGHPVKDLVDEISRRGEVLKVESDWNQWFDTGLMAMGASCYREAAYCFAMAVEDSDFSANPYGHAYLGRAVLKARSPESACVHYEDAVRLAGSDPALGFQIKFMFAMDLYQNGQIALALKEGGPVEQSLNSTYPLEAVFALYEGLLRAWGRQDQEEIHSLHTALQARLGTVAVREGSAFEQRRYEQAAELSARVVSALSGNTSAQMILHEESCDFEFKYGKNREAADRLKPWTEQYSLASYKKTLKGYEVGFADSLTWVYLNYGVAECLDGNYATAEIVFRDYIEQVSFDDYPRKVTEAWCWLGYTLFNQDEYENAKNQFEIGLSMDADGSDSELNGLPTDPLQQRIIGGKLRYQQRLLFVKWYRDTLLTLKAIGE